MISGMSYAVFYPVLIAYPRNTRLAPTEGPQIESNGKEKYGQLQRMPTKNSSRWAMKPMLSSPRRALPKYTQTY
jgi:hypothetical protein